MIPRKVKHRPAKFLYSQKMHPFHRALFALIVIALVAVEGPRWYGGGAAYAPGDVAEFQGRETADIGESDGQRSALADNERFGRAVESEAGEAEASETGEAGAAAAAEPAAFVEATEFRMANLNEGWVRYSDGAVKVTRDSGETWTEAEQPPVLADGASADETFADQMALAAADRLTEQAPAPVHAIAWEDRSYPVKQIQFVTGRIGWALVHDATGTHSATLFATADGGASWHAETTDTVQAAIAEETAYLRQLTLEAAYYPSAEAAREAVLSDWMVLPDTAAPGDVVLVRHKQPGNVEWQGKQYALQPFGAGYFTYLPVPAGAAAGTYPIGDKTLTITAINFPTQRLEVSQQMESMRRDTERIQADQRRVNEIRSTSAAEFLFDGEFMVPLEGRLSTPFGFTRYINGNFSGSHMAIDIAAPEGTPVYATNDGVVLLADLLYLPGNTVYIDHGMGLVSQYAHLSEFRVKDGEQVKKGQVVGLVGSTGFSTGPHLHFTFFAHNVSVNPNLFFDTTPFHWQADE